MGAVHGVHMKYAIASGLSLYGAHYSASGDDASSSYEVTTLALLWLYSAAIHALITTLFILRCGEWILGKRSDGTVPLWSYAVFAPFHAPTWLYTWLHTLHSERHGVPVASEVAYPASERGHLDW